MPEIRIPKQKNAIIKRDRIIEKGFELMCENGFYNTSTPDIAKYANVSTGIIYQYFNDKKDIFIEGIKNYSNSIMFPMIELLENEKVNLKDTKNFSLYKTRLLRNKKPAIKPIITEYYSKQEKMHNINKLAKSSKKISKYFYPFKTKYIFKCQDKIPTIKFKGLPDTVKNINKFYIKKSSFFC